MLRRTLFFLLAIGIGLIARASDEPRNLSLLKQEIVQYIDSGRYDREMASAAAIVVQFLETRVKAAPPTASNRLAIVFDIDETMLSNLPHIRAQDFGYVAPEWEKWVAKGEAPVIAPVREIFRAARRHGVAVLFLSGRREGDRPGTEKNLREVGVSDYAELVLKPDGAHGTNAEFKTAARVKFEQQGWTIIANVGDQASDLAGEHAERTFKLPDPFYFAP